MTEEEIKKFIELIDNLLEANEKDALSSQRTKDLIKKNISGLKESVAKGQEKSPSEYGKPITWGIGVSVGEFRVSRDVMEAAHAVDDYYETL